jgi:hypothetical protein
MQHWNPVTRTPILAIITYGYRRLPDTPSG